MNAHTPKPERSPTYPPFANFPLGSAMAMDRMDNEEVNRIVSEMIADCEVPTVAMDDWSPNELTRLQAAAADAYWATKRWTELYERHQVEPTRHLASQLFGAREVMRDRHVVHADEIEIDAIGDIGATRNIRPGYYGTGLCVHEDGIDDPILVLPRGLGRNTVLVILNAYDDAYARGRIEGANEITDTINAALEQRR